MTEWDNDYFVIDKTEDVRPYGYLLYKFIEIYY